jgi:DNA-binding NarL/FixJ family response regulator
VTRTVALTGDLLDGSKLTGALPDVELVRTVAAAAGAGCIIVDVGRFGDAIAELRAILPDARIVAYGRHDDPDALSAALAAGANEAMPRSRFFRDPAAAVAPG